MKLGDALKTAVNHHNAGRFDEAERLYSAILQAAPTNADALHLSGLIRYQSGNHDAAIERIARALKSRGDSPDIWMNYGTVLSAADRVDEAKGAYERALALKPDHSGALSNLGTLYQAAGDHAAAIDLYRRALELDPKQGTAWTNLGLAQLAADAPNEACAALSRAADLAPDLPSAHYNLGTALQQAARLGDAVAAYRRCVELDPMDYKAWTNLGTVLRDQALFDDARTAYDHALKIAPSTPFTSFNKALLHLLLGDFAAGWPAYEERLRSDAFPWKPRPFTLPYWDGGPVGDGRLLVGWEQGVGDQVMFAACLPALVDTGVSALVECEDRLIPLFRRSFPSLDFAPRSTPPSDLTSAPDLAAQIHLGSLPGLLRPDPMAVEPGKAFLAPDPDRVSALRDRYSEDGKAVVGISWRSGNATEGEKRSIPLTDWAPILGRPDLRFVSLQYGDHGDEIERAPGDVFVDPDVDALADLDGFAAQVAAMDLVITIDNSTAHFGGALGVPTWVLLTQVPEWRWLADGDASYWYKSVRLFRQSLAGEWAPVIAAASGAIDRHDGLRP